jgi:hypothetical protein
MIPSLKRLPLLMFAMLGARGMNTVPVAANLADASWLNREPATVEAAVRTIRRLATIASKVGAPPSPFEQAFLGASGCRIGWRTSFYDPRDGQRVQAVFEVPMLKVEIPYVSDKPTFTAEELNLRTKEGEKILVVATVVGEKITTRIEQRKEVRVKLASPSNAHEVLRALRILQSRCVE